MSTLTQQEKGNRFMFHNRWGTNGLGAVQRGCARSLSLFPVARVGVAVVAGLLALAPATAFGQVCGGIQNLGTLGGPTSRAIAVSADASVVVGNALTFSNESRAFRRGTTGGLQSLGTLGGNFSEAIGLSANGTVVVGNALHTNGQLRAFRWTAAGGMQDLGTFGGVQTTVRGVSADGDVVVGQSFNAASNGRAFRWTLAGGMQDLGALAGHTFSRADLVSADGNVVIGISYPDASTAQLFRAFRWTTAGGMQELGTLGGSEVTPFAVSANGSTVVGTSVSSRAVRWTEAGGFQDLGTLGGSTGTGARAVSADGSVVVGSTSAPSVGSVAYRWTEAGGMQNLGVPAGGQISAANAVSLDGATVVGEYITPTNQRRVFRWTQESALQDIGSLGTTEARAFAVTPNGGTIVGYSRDTLGRERAYIWGGDKDGDGLLDDWECNGVPYFTAPGVQQRFILDSTGDGVSDADWMHKDLFVEIDALAGRMISADALQMVIDRFEFAPRTNPDGIPGITLHLQVSDVNLVSNSPWTVVSGTNGWVSEFDPLKTTHFGTGSVEQRRAKAKAFRYAICANRIDDNSLGTAELPGNDFFLTLGERLRPSTPVEEASTFMHELGHTLGLGHGGGDGINGKPNYVSVMNYALTRPYGFSQLFWTLDYSREKLPTLEESTLSEPSGITSTLSLDVLMPFGVDAAVAGGRGIRYVALAGIPTDWNNDGAATSLVATQDLNYLGNSAPFAAVNAPSPSESLHGFDDWANVQLAIGTTGDYADFVHQTMPTDEVTGAIDEWLQQNLTGPAPACDPIDFNQDSLFPDTTDIADFLSVFAGGVCDGQPPTDPPCNTDIDFNNDGLFPDTDDITALLRVFAGGPCV